MKRWIVRTVLGVAALVVLAVGAAAVFVLTFDASKYRGDITAAVEAATGHKLRLDGRIEARILTLSPAITLHDASLRNPPGFSRAKFATAKRVHLIVRLEPLLARRLEIVRLEIEGGDVLFETNAKGERNWVTSVQTKGLRGGDFGPDLAGLSVERMEVHAVRLGYLHGPTKLESVINFDEMAIAAPALDKPIAIKATGAFEGTKIRTEGSVGTLGELLEPRPGPTFPAVLKITFGRSELEAVLRADLTASVPTAEGKVTAKLIDLDELMAKRAPPLPDARLFSAEPLPLGLLNAFDAAGEIAIEALVLRRQRVTDLAAKYTLKGGELTATPFAFTLAGARIAGELRIAADSAAPAIALKASGSGVRLREVTQLLFDRATVSSNATFTVNVNGRGRSMREIASTLGGPVIVALGPGPINAGVLDFLSKDVFSIHRTDQLSLVCALARFDFARGVGTSRRIVIDTTRAAAYGSGIVNLGSETVDMTFASTTKGKSLASVAALVPVRVHGPMRNPSTTPDLSRTPEEVMKSVVGVVELPGEILTSIFGVRGSSSRSAGCGSSAPTAAERGPHRGDGLLNRGGDMLRRLNPF